jgi:molybdopterin-guanine dinucleotide biosynthesis protein A
MGGGDKAMLQLAGETLIERAIARARPQVGELLINANGDTGGFAKFGLEILTDRIGGFLGPLAGIFAGLDWMREMRPGARWLASFACDCPFFPREMVERLIERAEAENVSIAYAASGVRHHPVFAVWSASLPDTSESALEKDGLRKVDDFIARHRNISVQFASDPVDPFLNINTPEDLVYAESLMARTPASH